MSANEIPAEVSRFGALRVEGLRKRLPGFDLEADFTIHPGERAAVVGRSGGGKTTLLRMIAGLESPEAEAGGRIRIGTEEITRVPPEARQIGVVFQEQLLFPALSVLENVTFGLRVRGVARKEREEQAMPWLQRLGLADLRQASVDRLSGGERQRVAFLRAIVWKPRALLLDEPFSALDPSMREILRRELLELHKLWPVPLLLVSHDEADVSALSTVRLQLEETADGRLRKFTRNP